ncbi:hypothetical protein [Streptomyces sp. G1]|uniref:hypothetical protein n=1 Tax=Streptomyces sp. G1 TaxID=361572 RepID=UPI002030BFF9|nr:hypothetical protein [Streptomyces sp. G1]MCM1964886.1 hypothetical protein [Streptomyces sp. G1]
MSPSPIPSPDESVQDMHAYSADDYAQNPGAREPRPHEPLPRADGFIVENPNPEPY